MYTEVILVDQEDQEIGAMEKLEAHRQGLLHRAFSVFILNKEGEMLLHQRASQKYHSPDLWTNACCSHPAPGETTLDAAKRRLQEEMGFSCELTEIDSFVYRVQFENGLIEHEYDHLFLGFYSGEIKNNPQEVRGYKFLTLSEIDRLLDENEEAFSFWFRIAYPQIKEYLSDKT